jgi:hypothetical protein
MAPVTCEHCGSVIQNAKNLSRHQLSIKCMDIQRELGLNPQPDIYTCNCGFSSNRKDKLNLHKKKCSVDPPSLTINDNSTINNTNITNNTQINLINFDSKMIEIFLQRVKDSVPADVLRELCEKGYTVLSDQVIVNSIKNENGGSDIRVADLARQKLVTKIEGVLEDDMGAHKTGARIGATVDEVLSWSHKKGKQSEKILETIRDANDDRKDGRPELRKRIIAKCPRSFDEKLPGYTINRISPLESIIEEADRKEAKEKERRGRKWIKHLQENKMTDPEAVGRFWDSVTGLVWTENSGKISLMGRSAKYQGILIKFCKKDLALIDQLGLSDNVMQEMQDPRSTGLLEPIIPEPKPKLSNSERWFNKFIQRSYPLGDTGFLANRFMKFVVKLGFGGDFTIVGGLCSLTKDVIGLDDSQISELEEAEVDDHVDLNAKPKRYSHNPKEITTDTVCHTSAMEFLQQAKPDIGSSVSKNIEPLPFKALDPITIQMPKKVNCKQKIDLNLSFDNKDELDNRTRFLSSSKRLEDGSWVCQLREFHNLVFRPVNSSGRDGNIKTKGSLSTYQHVSFIGNAMEGIDHIRPLTNKDREIMEDIGLIHVPLKVDKDK